MRKLCFLLYFFIFLIPFSCSDRMKIPKGVLPRDKMEQVLWDMISAGEFLNSYTAGNDSIDKLSESAKLYGKVLKMHNVTLEEFNKSYSYYQLHPELMKSVLDSLSKKEMNGIGPGKVRRDSLPGRAMRIKEER